MRTRAGLTSCLWRLGQHQEAIDHYQEMLRLNPSDNQGIRYILLTCYMTASMDAAAKRLLGEYEDDASATWLYNWALLRYRQGRMGKKAKSRLQEVINHNPTVIFTVPTATLVQRSINPLPILKGVSPEVKPFFLLPSYFCLCVLGFSTC